MAGPVIFGPMPNIVVTPDPDDVYNRYDTYLAIDPNDPNHMVGVCRRFYGPGANYQDILEFQSTNDGGQTWASQGLVLPPGDYYSISDPWIGIAPNGNIYVIGLPVVSSVSTPGNFGDQGVCVCCYSSSDGGETWTTTILPCSDTGNPDNPFGAIDQVSGNVYAVWNSNDTYGGPSPGGTLAFASSPDGVNWEPSPAALAGGNSIYDLTRGGFSFVNISVAPDDGSVHIIAFDESSNVSYGRSLDQGRTFQFGAIAKDQVGTGDIWLATSPGYLAPVPPPAIYAAGGGNVFASWSVDLANPAALPPPKNRVCIATCADGGAAWAAATVASSPVNIPLLPLGDLSDTAQDQYFLPRLAGMPNGVVGCCFWHLTAAGAPGPPPLTTAEMRTCLAASLPTGFGSAYFDPSATKTVLVSTMWTSPVSSNPVLRHGIADAYFVGDFIGLVGTPSGFAPYWSDTRQSVPGAATAEIITSYLAVQSSNREGPHLPSYLPGPGPHWSGFGVPNIIMALMSEYGMSLTQAVVALLSGQLPPLPIPGPNPVVQSEFFSSTSTLVTGSEMVWLSLALPVSEATARLAAEGLTIMERGLAQLNDLVRATVSPP